MSTYEDGQVGDNTVLLQWASKINSDLNKQQLELLDSIQILNSFMKASGTGETLVSVGSSVDGSKVNIPRDAGDVDVLVVSGKVKVSERLFEYVPGFPAFLTIPVKEEHLDMFRSVKPVGGGYLPASILQDMEKEWFNLVKVIITSKLLTKSADDRMRLVRRSKVGFEQQEVTGVRSDLGGILKLPNEKTGRGEGLFNALTYLNEGVDVIRSEILKKKESGKHVKVTQEGRSSTCKEKRESYKGVEDIVHLIGDTISKCKSFGDSDSEESEIDCDDVKYDRGAPLIESNINENKEADPVREIGVSKDETSTSNNDISSVCDEKRETLNKEPEYDNVDVKQSAISTQAANSENSNATLQSNTTRAFDKPIFANDIKNEESGASRKRFTNATGEDTTIEYENIESADFVPAFMFSGWPKPAAEWLHRIRKWPTESVKQEVLKTSCQVIVKPLPTKVNSDGTYTPTEEDNVFRLSFASQEVILAHSLNDTQMTCWKILKAFQKSFFETTPRVMTSYLWKNAIFWISEEIDPAFWKQENTLACTIKALDFVLDCLHNKVFPQYFVRDMNLVVQCDAETIVKTTETIKVLKKNPELYLRQFIENPPSPNVVRVTSTDKENLLKSKEKNQDFRVMKVEFLNAFSGIARKMTDDKDEGFVGVRERMRSGITDTIEEIKTHHEKRHNDKDDVKRRTLLNDTFDSFKGLFESIGDNASKSDDESVIPAPFKKTISSMLNLVVSGMAKRDNDDTSEKTSAADETSSETRGKRMEMDDFDLD